MAKFIAAIALSSLAIQAIRMKDALVSLGDDDDDVNVDPNMATDVNQYTVATSVAQVEAN